MFDDLTERELLLYFALFWMAAVAVWILLDFLGNNWPKRRFRPRGYRIPMGPRRRREVTRAIRQLRDEEIRQTLESARGRPTTSLSKARQIRTAARPRPSWLSAGAVQSSNGGAEPTDQQAPPELESGVDEE
ncbi:MAG: hypothetical protein OEW42_04030 [Acidimicrobiia bacterium]|nr:hypothetical protein [Acidimicrobiia bacterium]MDH5236371.1 hypothetical protein [Acidimicrobiia bacterium]